MELELRHDHGIPYVRVRLGRDPLTGQPRRVKKTFAGMSDAEALAAAKAWYEKVTRASLGDALELYLETKRTPNTRRTYGMYARRYAADLAKLPVEDVTVAMLNRLFLRLMDGGADGERPLSATTVNGFKQFLQGAWNFFVNNGLAEHNVAKETIRMQTKRYEGVALDDASLSVLLKYVDAELEREPTDDIGRLHRNAAFAVWLALVTGTRAGEVCALRRQDVIPRISTLSVNGSVSTLDGRAVRQDHTKGKRSRSITLEPDDLRRIREHERWQDGYLDHAGPTTPLVTTDGAHIKPKCLSDQFRRIRRELGLDKKYHFHSLRHTHATYLLQAHVDPRTVQERLGHAAASTTLNTYAHAMPGRDAEAARSINQTFKEIAQW